MQGRCCAFRFHRALPPVARRQAAARAACWRRERRTVFVYFDNDQKSTAPTDARRLFEILQQARR
jgi:uncharacterized protein YecE (DUF72 family)